MSFRKAVRDTPDIAEAFCEGLRALRKADRQHVSAEDPKRLRGSVDVDRAVKDKYANASRWDYAVGHQVSNQGREMVYWIEIHPAKDAEVKVVISKLEWLKHWLREKAPELNVMYREFIWLSSGRTSFTLSSPQQKRLALLGLQHKGRVFQIPSETVP